LDPGYPLRLLAIPFGTPFKAPKEFFTDATDASEAVGVAEEILELASESSEDAT
jgi:hypothetical protein